MLIAQLCDFGHDGDARYRIHEPSQALARWPGVAALDIHFHHRHLPWCIEHADILVLQFVNDWDLLSICSYRRRRGLVTVFEANDDFFDLQPWNPIAAAWANREVQVLYRRLLSHADGVQTSSAFLANRWRDMGARDVAVFPNQLTQVPDLQPSPEQPFTVGWAGSPGHFADLLHIAPALQEWLQRHSDTRLALMCNELAQSFFTLPPERVVFQPFGTLEQYLGFLQQLDVGLAPLLPTDYNRGRSDVKFLEYSAMGVLGVYQDLEPYRQTIDPGVTGILARSTAELIDGLDRLYDDAELRHRIRGDAHRYVGQNRRLADHIGERVDWYRRLQHKENTPAVPLPVEFAAYRDPANPDYLAVIAERPEQALLEAIGATQPEVTRTQLQRLLVQVPDYASALIQSTGNGNDTGHTERCLESARRLEKNAPYSSKWRLEQGRAEFLRGDRSRSLALLSDVIDREPDYLPAWQYQLKLLSIMQHPEREAWARRGLDRFPDCYRLGFLAIENLPDSQRIPTMRNLLNAATARLALFEYPLALRCFREAILGLIRDKPPQPDSLDLLRRATERFPESGRLLEAYADHLQALGDWEAAFRQRACLARSRQAAALVHEEYPDASVPYPLTFIDFIARIQTNDSDPAADQGGYPQV